MRSDMNPRNDEFAVETAGPKLEGLVAFKIDKGAITATSNSSNLSLSAKLVLNDEGECRMLVDGK